MEYSTFSETLGCPVCHELCISPIYQCQKGHLICKDCLPKLKEKNCPECPICRTPLPQEDIRSLSTEQLTENLDVKCKNATEGCKVLTKVAGIPQHLTNCPFVEDAWCLKMEIDRKCCERYFLKDFPTHRRCHHKQFYYEITPGRLRESIELRTQFDIMKLHFLQTSTWQPMFFELQESGDIYIVTSSSNSKKATVTFKIFLRRGDASKGPTPDMKVPITVKSAFSTVTWDLIPAKEMAEGQVPQEIQLLETFSLSLNTIFPRLRRPQYLKWDLIFDFPEIK